MRHRYSVYLCIPQSTLHKINPKYMLLKPKWTEWILRPSCRLCLYPPKQWDGGINWSIFHTSSTSAVTWMTAMYHKERMRAKQTIMYLSATILCRNFRGWVLPPEITWEVKLEITVSLQREMFTHFQVERSGQSLPEERSFEELVQSKLVFEISLKLAVLLSRTNFQSIYTE